MELGGVLRDLQSLADTTERVDMLTLAATNFNMELYDPEDDLMFDMDGDMVMVEFEPSDASKLDKADTTQIMDPPDHMGDPLGHQEEEVLRGGAPYPGDDPLDPRTCRGNWFLVDWYSPTQHIINDKICTRQ